MDPCRVWTPVEYEYGPQVRLTFTAEEFGPYAHARSSTRLCAISLGWVRIIMSDTEVEPQ